MSTVTITKPDIKVQLTMEQLITAVRQLDPGEWAKLAKVLTDSELDMELTQLIADLYHQPPIDGITDDEILAEIKAVRRQRA